MGTEDAAERQSKLLAWQAGLEERERAAEDLMERSKELREAERQVTYRMERRGVKSYRLSYDVRF